MQDGSFRSRYSGLIASKFGWNRLEPVSVAWLVYETTPPEIIPLNFRLTGPVFPIIVIALQFKLWDTLWVGACLAWRFRSPRHGTGEGTTSSPSPVASDRGEARQLNDGTLFDVG